ncbi:MAG: glycosyltransferase [Maricaulaceae bacterium]
MSEPDPPETTAAVEPTLARTGFDPKASFEGAHLTLRADRAFDLVDLTLDGVQAAPEWRSPKEGPSPVITVGLPPWVFDARPHRIDATVLAESLELDSPEERRTLSLAHQSDYDGEIQELHPARIRGWIRDRARPRAEIDLEIVLEPGGVKRVRADERLYDSAVTAQSEPRFRIDAPLPDAPHPPSRIVRVKLAGADHYPLPALIIGDGVATATAALNAQVLGAPAPGPVERYWAARTAGPALLKAVRDGEAVRLDVSELGEEPTPAPDYDRGRYGKRRTPIRVVIPAYKDLDVTRACLKSVAEARVRTPFAVTVIDDAGPEPGFGKGLRTTAAALGFDYQRNTVNLGFVRTANLGFGLDDEADVVLLNSDTRVYDGWLDRLHAAAYSADDIATVTPFSNNATICSLPDMRSRGGAVFGFDYAGLNAIAGEVNAGVTVDLPTGVGFCLYMRRVALREVGVFDAERFGRGYGEENDFCLRAMARGWRNVAACDVVVAHVGGRSFGADGARLRKTNTAALEALYPDYTPSIARFVARDPLARARNRLLKEVWRRRSAARDQGGIIVLLAPGLGGGATHHADNLARRLIAEGRITLIARRVADAKGGGFTISDPTNDDHLYYPEADGFEGFAADVLDLADILHVHGLIDLDVNILGVLERTDRAIFVTLHDYFYLCPRVTLLDATGQYCGLPPVRRCELCVQTGGVHNGLDPSFKPQAMRVEGWRDRWRAILEKADTVFAPSQDVADRYRSIWPDVEITVRPHWWH